jgi:hypothetical protein
MWLELYFKKIMRTTIINGELNGSRIPALQSQSWTETLLKDLLANTRTRSHATPLSIAEEKNTPARFFKLNRRCSAATMKLVFLRILTLRSLLTSISERTHCKHWLAGQHVCSGNAILTKSKKINQIAVLTAPKLYPADCGSGEYRSVTLKMDAVPSPESSEHPSTTRRRKANDDKKYTSFQVNVILSEDMPHFHFFPIQHH